MQALEPETGGELPAGMERIVLDTGAGPPLCFIGRRMGVATAPGGRALSLYRTRLGSYVLRMEGGQAQVCPQLAAGLCGAFPRDLVRALYDALGIGRIDARDDAREAVAAPPVPR